MVSPLPAGLKDSTMLPEIETEYLVVGAGPAGASLACFLGQNGLNGIMIAGAPGTTETPRAHLVNPFALECFRDIAMEDEAMRMSVDLLKFGAFRYGQSLLGKELATVSHWEAIPETEANTKMYTPSRWVDLPQSYMEPILVKYASHNGFTIRFSTELQSVEKDAATGQWLAKVADLVRGDKYIIRTRFLFGADGGRSRVARDTGAQFTSKPSQGVACNILFQADVGHLMDGKLAQLHTIVNPSAKSTPSPLSVIRMIRHPHEWMLIAVTPGVNLTSDPYRDLKTDSAELTAWVRELVGLDENPLAKDIPIKIHRIDPWVIREVVADEYQPSPYTFLLGDAAHRHPPAYGLGSNTCVQDAYNLAWKVAYVARGLAGQGLLASYSAERQPVGAQLVLETNAAIGMHVGVWAALGLIPAAGGSEVGNNSSEAVGPVKAFEELGEASVAGEARRKQLHEALEYKMDEGRSLGLCGNQWYVSDAVYLDDEQGPRPALAGDPIIHLQVSTYPGSRLPHAKLDVPMRRKIISTHDLAGKGAFCLFTGYGGDAWQEAAEKISQATGIPIHTYKIGFGLDWQDVHREWYARRGVDDSGCVLVRPDRFVAWRSTKVVDDCESKLTQVLNKVLCRQ